MLYSADLYPILISYARKNNSPYIVIDPFLGFLEKTAKHYTAKYPAWNKWLQEKEVRFWAEMTPLIDEGKCAFISDTDDGRIFLHKYYPEMIYQAYQNMDSDADIPFPSEDYLRFELPDNQEKYPSSESDFLSVLETPGLSADCIVKINFSSNFGSALAVIDMIPEKLANMAVLKLRNYLKRFGNMEYAVHKLAVPLQGKEIYIKQQLENITLRPATVYNNIREAGELSYIFWSHFCVLVKNEVKRKQDRLPVDIAAFQAAVIIENVNAYHKKALAKQREVEQAFKALESYLAKPPHLFSMGDILKFTDSKGKPLLGQYTAEELEGWLKKQTTESKNNELPPFYVFRSLANNDKCFMQKEKVFTYCVNLILEARRLVNEAILKRWSRLILEYKSEPAMENDDQFEKELYKTGIKLCPDLMNLLEDPKLFLLYEETQKSPGGVPSTAMIYYNGALIPYSSLFQARRKDILHDAKVVLPFWYSVPILLAIVKFFKGKPKNEKANSSLSKEKDSDDGNAIESKKSKEIRAAIKELEVSLLPAGCTLDKYLGELEDRWSQRVDRKARDNLIHDVQFLARDNLRRITKVDKQFKPTQSSTSEIAEALINRNTALNSLSDRESLRIYLQLYMLKLLNSKNL